MTHVPLTAGHTPTCPCIDCRVEAVVRASEEQRKETR